MSEDIISSETITISLRSPDGFDRHQCTSIDTTQSLESLTQICIAIDFWQLDLSSRSD
jgi:hypothetical protein